MYLDLEPGHVIRGFRWTGMGEDGGDGTGSGPAGDGDGTGAGDGAGSGGPDGGDGGSGADDGSADGIAEGFSFTDPTAAPPDFGFDALSQAFAVDTDSTGAIATGLQDAEAATLSEGSVIGNLTGQTAQGFSDEGAPSWLTQMFALAKQALISKGATAALGPYGFVATPAINAAINSLTGAIGASGSGTGATGCGAGEGSGGVIDVAPVAPLAPILPASPPVALAPGRDRVIFLDRIVSSDQMSPRYVSMPAQEAPSSGGAWIAALGLLALLS